MKGNLKNYSWLELRDFGNDQGYYSVRVWPDQDQLLYLKAVRSYTRITLFNRFMSWAGFRKEK